MQRRFRGVYPVLYAFFDETSRLDHDAMRLQVEHCIGAGAHGIAVLGLVTEVNRMTTAERQEVVELIGDAIAGRIPYAVTIAEQDPEAQIDFARMAARNGADWAILQPPPGKGHSEDDLQRHFGRIADAAPLPVAVQNNPVNLDSHLSPEGLVELVRRHANITLLKAEGWSVDIARVVEALGGSVDAFGGHGGIEFLSLLRSGGAGLIPAPDCLASQVAIYEAMTSRDHERVASAERLHRELLPLIIFMTRNMGGLITYGKRVMARRMGLEIVHDRSGAPLPTEFGMREMDGLFADVLKAEGVLLSMLSQRRDRIPA